MSIIILIIIVFALFESFNRVACYFGFREGIERILASFTIFWTWQVAISWLLSFINLLHAEAFGIVTVGTVTLGYLAFPKPTNLLFQQITYLVKLGRSVSRNSFFHSLFFVAIIIWFGWAVYRIILLPPTNWDSMTYHLPMIANWLQHGQVGFYETSSLRQVTSPVNGEMLQLFHVIYLKNDLIVGLAQLEMLAISIMGVFYLSRLSGVSIGWALNASVTFLTVPLILLESYTTQNDLIVCGGMILCLVWIAVYLKRFELNALVLLGLSLGLLMGTKFHMLIAVPLLVFILILIFWYYRRDGVRLNHLIVFLPVMIASLVFLGSIVYIHNLVRYGLLTPISVPGAETQFSSVIFPSYRTLADNFIYFGEWWFIRCWDFLSPRVWKHDDSHYGPLYGYVLFPLSLVVFGVLFYKIFKKEKFSAEFAIPLIILLVALGTFIGFNYGHRGRPHDLRYFLFLPPLLSVTAMWFLSRTGLELKKGVSLLILIPAIATTYFAFTRDSNPDVQIASSLEPSARTSVQLGLNNPDRVIMKRLDQLVRPGESILFCGQEDDWNYLLFGNDLSRRVYYAGSIARVRYYLDYYPINWVVVNWYYDSIYDYLQHYPQKYRELHFTSVYSENVFHVFRVEPQDWNPAWVDGIYGDAWSQKKFLLGADMPGRFIVQGEIPDVFTRGVSIQIVFPDSTSKDTLLAHPGLFKLELPLDVAGIIRCTLDTTFVPSKVGKGDDSRILGIRILVVDFKENPEEWRTGRINVFP